MSEIKEVFGRTITGDVQYYTSNPQDQEDPAKFIAALDKLLAVDGVESVRWCQATPYFNDGDACEFDAYLWDGGVRLTYGDEDGGDYGNGWYNPDDFYTYSGKPLDPINGHDVTELVSVMKEFETVVNSGSHFTWLHDTFGDPACITATPDGFDIEYYAHE